MLFVLSQVAFVSKTIKHENVIYTALFFFFEKWNSWIPPDVKIIADIFFDQQTISVLFSMSYQFHYSQSHTLRLLSMTAAMGGFLLFYNYFCCYINHNIRKFDVVLLFWSFFFHVYKWKEIENSTCVSDFIYSFFGNDRNLIIKVNETIIEVEWHFKKWFIRLLLSTHLGIVW